jgi:hypothetical protein
MLVNTNQNAHAQDLEHTHESGFLSGKLLGTFHISSDADDKANKRHRAKRKFPLGLVLYRRPRRKKQTEPKQQQQQRPEGSSDSRERSAKSKIVKTVALGPQSLDTLLGLDLEADESVSASSSYSSISRQSSTSSESASRAGLLSDQEHEEYYGTQGAVADQTEAAADQAEVQEAAARASFTLFGKLGLDSIGWAVTGRSLCAICNRPILKGSCRFSFYHHIHRPSRWMHSACFKSYYNQSSTLIQDQVRTKLKQLAQESPVDFHNVIQECRAFVT